MSGLRGGRRGRETEARRAWGGATGCARLWEAASLCAHAAEEWAPSNAVDRFALFLGAAPRRGMGRVECLHE